MRSKLPLLALTALVLTVTAQATTIYTGSVTFSSDLEANKLITLPSWDTNAGTLTSVLVEWFYSGTCILGVDNDDVRKLGLVNARIIRTWTGSGPGGAFSFGNTSLTSPPVALGLENGDGPGLFDTNGPDGHNFGPFFFTDLPGTPASNSPLPVTPYETPGPGTVQFNIDVLNMVNDLQWAVTPDQWQMQVRDPRLDVKVRVTYDGEYIPEPGTIGLMLVGLGALVTMRRRRTA